MFSEIRTQIKVNKVLDLIQTIIFHKSLLPQRRIRASSSLLSYLNLATLQAQLQQPLVLSSSISVRMSSMVLRPKNQLLNLFMFSQYFFYSSSSHQNSANYCYQSADLNRAILSPSKALSICSRSLYLIGTFLPIYLQASQISFQTYASSCQNYQDSSYYYFCTCLSLYSLRLLHFLFTWSGFIAIQSQKIIVATHLSSSFCFNFVLTLWRVGSTLLPNSLANSMITFYDFSESLSPTNLKFLSPSSNILLRLWYLFRKSFSLIFQPSLTVLKLNFPLFLMQFLQNCSQICLRADDTLSTGFLPLLYSFIRQRSRDNCLAAESACPKGSINSAC